jgi:hypothetical protein
LEAAGTPQTAAKNLGITGRPAGFQFAVVRRFTLPVVSTAFP